MVKTALSALPLAGEYLMVAVGFVIVYRATRVLNFAQGALVAVGGYVCYSLGTVLPVVWALILGCIINAAIGAIIYLVTVGRLTGRTDFERVMVTIAVSIVLTALALMIWGAQTLYPKLEWNSAPLSWYSGLSVEALAVGGIALVVWGSIGLGVKFSRLGQGLQATAENPVLAVYRGVNVSAVGCTAWAAAAAAAGLAGALFGAQNGLSPTTGGLLGFAVFPAIILGGLESIGGVLIGSILLAEAQVFAIKELGGQYEDLVTYGLLFIALLVKPTGLFGQERLVRL